LTDWSGPGPIPSIHDTLQVRFTRETGQEAEIILKRLKRIVDWYSQAPPDLPPGEARIHTGARYCHGNIWMCGGWLSSF